MKCPDCGATQFYVKDPDDQYHISEFTLSNGDIVYTDSTDEDFVTVTDKSEIFCDTCAWHDAYNVLKSTKR